MSDQTMLYGIPFPDDAPWVDHDKVSVESNTAGAKDMDTWVGLYASPPVHPWKSRPIEHEPVRYPLPSPEEMREILIGAVPPECVSRALRRKCHACGAYPYAATDAELGYIIKCSDCGKVSAWGKDIESVVKMWLSMTGDGE